ncbi:MAG: hypothetical protein DMG80_09110 [Acidobacteria bacterium]|nr:MAG: hypothetical protein DMG80_09110 [Acidobacteriota bacterium]
MRCFVARARQLVLVFLLCVSAVVFVSGQANVVGQWTTLPTSMPINPVHVAMLHNGKVLVVSGSGNVPGITNYQAGIFDPATGLVSTQPISWDMFCNGMVILPDGRPLIVGGTIQYDPFHGETRAAVYDPATNNFTNVQPMAVGRWYPTATVMGDGRVMAFSGLDVNGGTTPVVQFFTTGTGWSAPVSAPWTPPLYPRMNLLPNGKVFYSGPGSNSAMFDPATQIWSQNYAKTKYGGGRGYGSSVLLPLTPANNYSPRVMIMGGANPSTATTEIIDLSQQTPAWQFAPSMSQPRIEMSAVLLPTGGVLALGGSLNDEQNSSASLNADLYDPVANTFSSAGANSFPRLYHSVALLLPDATVWVAGGNPTRGTYQPQMEIYQPAYLFTTDGQGHAIPATRPTIGSAPATMAYGSALTISSPDESNLKSVSLMRAGAATHAFDRDQRMVGLSFTDQGNGTLLLNAPVNGNLAPPGYYMLFVVNVAGVPSVASWVQVLASDFSLTATPFSQQVSQGGSTSWTATVTPQSSFTGTVNLAASGLPTGVSSSFNLPVLTAGDSTLSVTVSNSVAVGTYPFTISGTSGTLTHSFNASLDVRAAGDYTVTVTPASRNVIQGGSTFWTATVTPQSGFTDSVTLGVSGLPSGISASFSPPIVTSGDSTLNVLVGSAVAPGSYPFSISGISGAITHSTGATLVVQAAPDFAVTVTPALRKVIQGKSTSWTATVTPQNGFSDAITLGVSGLPTGVTAVFSSPVLKSGNSTLNVNVDASVPPGAYPFLITAVSGSLEHNANATLTVLVQGTFTIAVTPGSQAVTRNSTSIYTVTITPQKGFLWTVDLSVSGTGNHITASLDPVSVGANGTSTLTVNVDGSMPRGKHTLRVTGRSGQLSKTGTLVLTVQ